MFKEMDEEGARRRTTRLIKIKKKLLKNLCLLVVLVCLRLTNSGFVKNLLD